jgi:hypothetical protein
LAEAGYPDGFDIKITATNTGKVPNTSATAASSGSDMNGKAAQAIRDGDILGARLILERTIEGGDAKALLALAETYDPKALIRMNAKGVKGDAAHARKLYGQALARGVSEARGRLETLDQ